MSAFRLTSGSGRHSHFEEEERDGDDGEENWDREEENWHKEEKYCG